ncbi:MAG TPA: transposase, partial [Thermoanaerobaculia bacterium]|nr:transposase [Thermoanaerobaculia bacterium]
SQTRPDAGVGRFAIDDWKAAGLLGESIGAYFITICVQHRACLFGEIVNQTMMPNHVHGIIIVGAGAGACLEAGVAMAGPGQPRGVAPTRLSVPDVVHRFKTMTTTRYITGVKRHGWRPFPARLWQRNYHDHIIRRDASLERIRNYIATNPARWAEDPENPVGAGPRACPDGPGTAGGQPRRVRPTPERDGEGDSA